MPKNKHNDSTTLLKVVGAVVFLLFTFIYTYEIQCDLLAMIQYAWSDNQTHYDRLIGSCIITVVLGAISLLVNFLTHFPTQIQSLVYLPSLVAIGLLTGVTVSDTCSVHTTITSGIIAIATLILFVFLCINTKKSSSLFLSKNEHGKESGIWLSNTVIFLLMVMVVYSMGNTDRQLHTRLTVERLCHQGHYAEALQTGLPQHDDDTSLPMLRALALANTGELGEKLFSYNINPRGYDGTPQSPTPAPSILPFQNTARFLTCDPYPVWQTLGFVPRNRTEAPERYLQRELRRHTARKPAQDYLLCTYLLKGDLAEFARNIPRFYDMYQSHLPEHYSEALVLYNNLTHGTDTLVNSACKIMPAHTADYKDFQKMMRENKDQTLRTATLRDNYAGTYWFYYYLIQLNKTQIHETVQHSRNQEHCLAWQ